MGMAPKVDFCSWIKQYAKNDDATGALARGIEKDSAMPSVASKEDLIDHLTLSDAPEASIKAAEEAWDRFEAVTGAGTQLGSGE